MQLHTREARGFDSVCNLVKRRVNEDTDFFELRGQMRRDCRDLLGRYEAWAGREDETNCVRPHIGGELRVFKRGVGADFDPEGHWRGALVDSSAGSPVGEKRVQERYAGTGKVKRIASYDGEIVQQRNSCNLLIDLVLLIHSDESSPDSGTIQIERQKMV